MTFPQWIRLQRTGDTFVSYRSADGVTWTEITRGDVSLSEALLIGLNTNADRDETGTTVRVEYAHFSEAAANQGFSLTDIGDPLPVEPGHVTFSNTPGALEVVAGGARTWDSSDSFTYIHKEHTGDFGWTRWSRLGTRVPRPRRR